METTEYRGYRSKATSREGEPRVWQARWTAVRLSGSGAHSKSGSVRGAFTGEREADEAALGEARAWVDQNGQQEWLPLNLPRFGRHPRSHESAVGVCHGQTQAAGVHEGVQGGGGAARPGERQVRADRGAGTRSHGDGAAELGAAGGD